MVAAKKKPMFLLPVFAEEPKAERGPSPRNRQIYEAVRVRELTHRAAALEFKLAPSRIGQILEQVESWIARTGGAPTRTPRERVRISEHLHRARAEAWYGNLVRAFDDGIETRTDRVVVLDDKTERREINVKTVKRDPRIASHAWKIEDARHLFETGRLTIEPEELPTVERIREIEQIAREAVANEEADTAPETEAEVVSEYGPPISAPEPAAVGQVCNLSAAPEQVAPESSAPEPESPAPPQPTAPRDHRPPPMLLTEVPDDDELDRYWVLNEHGRREWRPPTIVSRGLFPDTWHTYQPPPPNPARRRKPKG